MFIWISILLTIIILNLCYANYTLDKTYKKVSAIDILIDNGTQELSDLIDEKIDNLKKSLTEITSAPEVEKKQNLPREKVRVFSVKQKMHASETMRKYNRRAAIVAQSLILNRPKNEVEAIARTHLKDPEEVRKTLEMYEKKRHSPSTSSR